MVVTNSNYKYTIIDENNPGGIEKLYDDLTINDAEYLKTESEKLPIYRNELSTLESQLNDNDTVELRNSINEKEKEIKISRTAEKDYKIYQDTKRWKEREAVKLGGLNPDDFDVKNYSINDLLDLFSLDSTTISEESEITDSAKELISVLDQNVNEDNKEIKDAYKKFFNEAKVVLVDWLEDNKTETHTDGFTQKKDIKKISKRNVNCSEKVQIDTSIISDRKIIACIPGSTPVELNRYAKTNFEVFLQFELKDTTRLALGNVVIPMAGYYSIDAAYETNYFGIKIDDPEIETYTLTNAITGGSINMTIGGFTTSTVNFITDSKTTLEALRDIFNSETVDGGNLYTHSNLSEAIMIVESDTVFKIIGKEGIDNIDNATAFGGTYDSLNSHSINNTTKIRTSKKYCVELPNILPKYPYDDLISVLSDALDDINISSSDMLFNFNKFKMGKFSIEVNDNNYKVYTIDWLAKDCEISCQQISKGRGKIRDNTLGHKMGWVTNDSSNRNRSIIKLSRNTGKSLSKTERKNGNLKDKLAEGPRVAEIAPSLFGTKFFKLQVTDYSRLRINYKNVGIASKIRNFKQPYYFNSLKSRIGFDCDFNLKEKYKENITRSSRKGTTNPNTFSSGLDSLTNAQKYTARAIENTNRSNDDTLDIDNNDGPGSSDSSTGGGAGNSNIYGGNSEEATTTTFIIPRDIKDDVLRAPIQYTGSRDNLCAIEYSNKTNIVKLKIALKDDRNRNVDLHGDGVFVTFNTEKEYETLAPTT